MKICCFGSLNIDYIYHVKHFVRTGETISSTECTASCGGKGLNQSVALARSGAEVYHAGNVGISEGKVLIEMLEKNGVHVEHVVRKDDMNGHAIIQVDERGENCIVLYGGTNKTVTQAQIERTIAEFDEGDYIVLQNEINMLPQIIQAAHERKMSIILNPSPVEGIRENIPLQMIDYLFVNKGEAMELSGKSTSDESCRFLHEKFGMTVVCTLGAEGAMIYNGKFTRCNGRKTNVVDTTGAGDTFLGYYVGLMSKGKSDEECLKAAVAAATLCVGRLGASDAIPERMEVERMLGEKTDEVVY